MQSKYRYLLHLKQKRISKPFLDVSFFSQHHISLVLQQYAVYMKRYAYFKVKLIILDFGDDRTSILCLTCDVCTCCLLVYDIPLIFHFPIFVVFRITSDTPLLTRQLLKTQIVICSLNQTQV